MHKHYPPFYPIYCRFFQFLFSNVSVNSSRCFHLNLTLSSQSRHIDHKSLSIYKRKHSLNRLLLHQNLKSSSILWGVIISYKPNIKPPWITLNKKIVFANQPSLIPCQISCLHFKLPDNKSC